MQSALDVSCDLVAASGPELRTVRNPREAITRAFAVSAAHKRTPEEQRLAPD
jgi:hypothetical protein